MPFTIINVTPNNRGNATLRFCESTGRTEILTDVPGGWEWRSVAEPHVEKTLTLPACLCDSIVGLASALTTGKAVTCPVHPGGMVAR